MKDGYVAKGTERTPMKDSKSLILFIALVVSGVAARVVYQDIPNFAPVAAIALFAGYCFASRAAAIAVPLLVMGISDRLIDAGGYAWPLMLTVYALLALPVFFSGWLQRFTNFDSRRGAEMAKSSLAVGGFGIASSVLFFLGTNAMVWATTTIYPGTVQGLGQCFVAALPFFRYTLAGDLVFASALFGALAAYRIAHSSDSKVVATVR